MLCIYIYVDDVFQYKTKVYAESSCPIIDLRIIMALIEEAQDIRFDMYDASSLSQNELDEIN